MYARNSGRSILYGLTLLPYRYESEHMVWQNNESPKSYGETPPLYFASIVGSACKGDIYEEYQANEDTGI